MSNESKEKSRARAKKEIFKSGRDVVLAWLAAVNGGRVDEILTLYSRNAQLLPTFSPDFLNDQEALRSYFMQLAARPNLKVELSQETFGEQQMSSRFCVTTGIYSFTFDIGGATQTFESRFTFVVDLSSANPIMHHHSAVLPDVIP